VCRFLPNGTLSFVNEAYCRAFNQRRDELIGSAFLPYINQEDRQTLKMCLASLSPQNPVATSELRIDTAVGVRWLQWTHHAIYDELGHMVNFQSVGRDITEKKEAEEKLRYLSMHDSLTGLYNRFYFEEEMKRLESSRHNPVAIIMWDVDGLKLINDTMGHDKGDELLVAASRIIKACFREGDAVARVGGDEFAVILPHTSRVIIENALARISNVIKDYNEEHPGLPLSISTGFAVRSEGDQSINEIFKEADNKMYREKLHSQQSNRSVLVHALMKALRERDFITEGHGDRLQQIVYDMAETLNLQNSSLNDLRLLANFMISARWVFLMPFFLNPPSGHAGI
jgi:diguanylate cyclase (GGDEF)-like protein/PAS domain S-box-containing protein